MNQTTGARALSWQLWTPADAAAGLGASNLAIPVADATEALCESGDFETAELKCNKNRRADFDAYLERAHGEKDRPDKSGPSFLFGPGRKHARLTSSSCTSTARRARLRRERAPAPHH